MRIVFAIVPVFFLSLGCKPQATPSKPAAATTIEEDYKPPANSAAKPLQSIVWVEPAKERWVTLGSAKMTIDHVEVGKVKEEGPFGGTSKEDLLIVSIRLKSTDKSKKTMYKPWTAGIGHPDATLTDNLKNSYRVTTFMGAVKGQQSRETTLYADEEPKADLLIFERPVPAATSLMLELDGEAVGQKGKFYWKIPRSYWK
jgi:hypothetical protein